MKIISKLTIILLIATIFIGATFFFSFQISMNRISASILEREREELIEQKVLKLQSVLESTDSLIKSNLDTFSELDEPFEAIEELNSINSNMTDNFQELKTNIEHMAEKNEEISNISKTVSGGSKEMSIGAGEIVYSVQLISEQATSLNEVIKDLTKKFDRFKT